MRRYTEFISVLARRAQSNKYYKLNCKLYEYEGDNETG